MSITGSNGQTINIWQEGNIIKWQNITAGGGVNDIYLTDSEFGGINITNEDATSALTINIITDIRIPNIFNLNNIDQDVGPQGIFIMSSDYITFNGNNHTFFIETLYFGGLIQNGDGVQNSQDSGGYQNIIIQNVKINGDKGSLFSSDQIDPSGYNDSAGWLCHHHFQYGTITNCSSNGYIPEHCGGIVGSMAAINGNITISNCYSTGDIGSDGNGGGGIFGLYAAFTDGSVTLTDTILIKISNCYSTGKIGGNGAGGIFGIDALNTNGTGEIDITNCYSTGSIGGGGSGGIFGGGAGIIGSYGTGQNSTIKITNCYSTGDISTSGTGTLKSGGIFGSNAGAQYMHNNPSYITLKNCYSFGASDNPAYSMRGNYAGDNIATTNINFTQINCFTKINGDIQFLPNGLIPPLPYP
jgi:hypothetical protein